MSATESTVAIMNAMGFTACFCATMVVIAVCVVVAAVQRSERHAKKLENEREFERMRLENSKEITVRK